MNATAGVSSDLESRHARCLLAGLTKWTFGEVDAALAEVSTAQAEAILARQACVDALDADPGYRRCRDLPAYWQYLETDAGRAAHLLLRTDARDGCPSFPHGEVERWLPGGGAESFPLTKWRKEAAKWRRWSARVRKELVQ